MTTRFTRYGLAALGLFFCFNLAACGGGWGDADPSQGALAGKSAQLPENSAADTPTLKCAP
ncbi:MAG: hypothetical protein R3E94_13770 [Burkholderiaceae bacterium]